ncbi:MAG: hypothetical protein OSB21_13735 [Myxococcota bacterium]|nr:hypothetical protein [Myxococcota bacterium]
MFLRLSILASLILISTNSWAQAIVWQAHHKGKKLPVHALVGGIDGAQVTPICRVKAKGGMFPGKILRGHCSFGLGGKEHRFAKGYEIALPGPSVHLLVWSKVWRRAKGQQLLKVGQAFGKPQAICRGKHKGKLVNGRISNNRCFVGYAGREAELRGFEALATSAANLPVLSGAKMPPMKIPGVKLKPADFWSGVYQRAHKQVAQLESGSRWGLRQLLGSVIRSGVLPLAALTSNFKGSIWRSGPHRKNDLKLHNTTNFGRYRPGFVRYLEKSLPDNNSYPAGRSMQVIYKRSLRKFARIFDRVDRVMSNNHRCLARMQKGYKNQMRKKSRSPWRSFSKVLQPGYCKGGTPKFGKGGAEPVIGQAALWWMRRRMDGTAIAWRKVLNKLLRVNDAAWFKAQSRR